MTGKIFDWSTTGLSTLLWETSIIRIYPEKFESTYSSDRWEVAPSMNAFILNWCNKQGKILQGYAVYVWVFKIILIGQNKYENE